MRDEPKNLFTAVTAEEYQQGAYGANLTGYILRHNHELLEEFLPLTDEIDSVLEVAGGGGHFPYLKHSFCKYLLTDVISLILPCDPGLAWRIGRRISSTRRMALRKGLPYEYLIAREHVNPIGNLVSIIRYHFDKIYELWWPLRIPLTDANLLYEVHIIT